MSKKIQKVISKEIKRKEKENKTIASEVLAIIEAWESENEG